MPKKLYLYCLIKSNEEKELGSVGLSATGQPLIISLKSFSGLGIVYTTFDLEDDEDVQPTRKNLINHQKTIELAMESASVLPFSFGTVVKNFDEMQAMVEGQVAEFSAKLSKIEGKIELSLKIMWEDMQPVFAEIVSDDPQIQQKRTYVANNPQDQSEKIELGRLVEESLTSKKEWMVSKILTKLSSFALEHKVLKNLNDEMIANLAFLVEKKHESQFDDLVNELSDEMNENMKFKYVGPNAPFNFID